MLIGSALLSPAMVQLHAQANDVKVYIALADSSTSYFPVQGHRMFFFKSPRDSIMIGTDASGSTTAHLVAGVYRLVSAAPVSWHGKSYSWNVPVSVDRNTILVDLNPSNATINGTAPTGAITTAMRPSIEGPIGGPDAQPAQNGGGSGSRKSVGTGLLLSFIIPGAGHFYADRNATGLAFLLVTAYAAGKAASDGPQDCTSGVCESTGLNTTWAGVAAGAWIISMIDGVGAVHRYNREHGFEPVVTSGASGTTRVGLSLRF